MLEALQYSFVQNAIVAGFLVSVAMGIIGTLVVVNKTVFVAGAIAHASYGGIGLALYFSLPFLLGTSAFAVATALVIAYFYIRQKQRLDTVIGALWAFGMAVGIIFVDLSPGYNVDLMSYLFGSILTVPAEDLAFLAVFDAGLVAFAFVFYPLILAVSYDAPYASLQGVKTHAFSAALFVLIALGIVFSIRSIGLILVIALLTVPVFIAELFSSSLARTMFYSALLSFAFVLGGLALAYAYNLTSGASIILVASGCFAVIFGARRWLS